MAYDEQLVARLRDVFAGREDVVEKKMFGGIAFMVRGHMCVGVSNDDLMARVGPDAHEQALERPHARVMDFTGRPLKGFVFVSQGGFETEESLLSWVDLCEQFVGALPPR